MKNLLSSYGSGYATSPTAGPVYLAAIDTTAQLIAAETIAEAVTRADENAQALQKRAERATWVLAVATIVLAVSTIGLFLAALVPRA